MVMVDSLHADTHTHAVEREKEEWRDDSNEEDVGGDVCICRCCGIKCWW
jgi:hypothetical protein